MGPSGSLPLHLATSSLVSSRHVKAFPVRCLQHPADPLSARYNVRCWHFASGFTSPWSGSRSYRLQLRMLCTATETRHSHINEYI